MFNALEIYNSINSYEDIKKLIGTQESLFLDFKGSSTVDGNPTKDDKSNFKEALSGFSNQEGGVIIWGIDCRQNLETGVDEAISEKLIENIGDFQKRLGDYFPQTTEPLIDGVLNKIIFFNDNSSSKKGFLLHYIPKTYKVSRVLDPKKSILFYKRYGTQFRPVESTEEIRSLFFRQSSPKLKAEVIAGKLNGLNGTTLTVSFSLKNNGTILAKFVSISTSPINGATYYDGAGNRRWDRWTESISGDGERVFSLQSGFVLHPGETSRIFTITTNYPKDYPLTEKLDYTIYAENMEPIKGSKKL